MMLHLKAMQLWLRNTTSTFFDATFMGGYFRNMRETEITTRVLFAKFQLIQKGGVTKWLEAE